MKRMYVIAPAQFITSFFPCQTLSHGRDVARTRHAATRHIRGLFAFPRILKLNDHAGRELTSLYAFMFSPFICITISERNKPHRTCLTGPDQAVPTEQLQPQSVRISIRWNPGWVCVVFALRPQPTRRQLQKVSDSMALLESISLAALAIFWSSQVKRSFSYSHERSKGRMDLWPTMMSAVFLRRLKTLCCT